MNVTGLQVRLITGSYTLVKRSRLLETSWGRMLYKQFYDIYKRHIEDPFYNLIRREPELFRGGHVIDVGANIGYTAALFARAIDPGFCVFAFEPEDLNFKILQETLRSFRFRSRIVPVQAAVGDTDGVIALARNEANPSDHRIATDTFCQSESGANRVFVPIRSIDNYLGEQPLGGPVRFIKVDVQGYEPAVCWGMERTLIANPECIVALEYMPAAMVALGFNPEALLRWFQDRDYRVETLHRDGTRSPGQPAYLQPDGYADLLFTRRLA